MNILFLRAFGFFFIACSCTSSSSQNYDSLLIRDGFSSSVDRDTDLIKIGNIHKNYTAVFYKHITKKNNHEIRKILFFHNKKYIASFEAGEITECISKVYKIICNVPESYGNKILLSDLKIGSSILLGGEFSIFEK